MVSTTYFGDGIKKTSAFLCFLLISQAGSCDPLTSDESKVGLIKIELTKNGNTIITIGNLWKLGRFSESRTADSVSNIIPVSARAPTPTSSTSYPIADNPNTMSQARYYHTSQIPLSPTPTVTTRKLMNSYDVTRQKNSNQNKRHLHNRAPNVASVNDPRNGYPITKEQKFDNGAKHDFIYKRPSNVELTTVPLTRDEMTPNVIKDKEDAHDVATPNIVTESAMSASVQSNNENDPMTAHDDPSKIATSTENDQMDLIDSERQLMNGRLQRIVDSHYSWNILNAEDADCGESNTDRIIGGVEASLGQFPWIARLGYTVLPEINLTEYRCGGVLIGQQFVLTAAHCVSNLGPRTTMTKVRLGEHNIKTTKDCWNNVCADPVQDFKPVNISAHEEFMKRKYGNDIAIIKLDRPAIYNGWVSPICLPKGDTLTTSYTGENANVAGWGIMNMDTQAMAERLQTVSLPILNLDECQKEYKKKVQLTEEQICAGSVLNKDACGGDSGGPLMKVGAESGSPQYFLLGVVSFGPSDCGKKEPGVYANVSYHMPWILDNVQKLSS